MYICIDLQTFGCFFLNFAVILLKVDISRLIEYWETVSVSSRDTLMEMQK